MPILSSKNKFLAIMLWIYGGMGAALVLAIVVMMVMHL